MLTPFLFAVATALLAQPSAGRLHLEIKDASGAGVAEASGILEHLSSGSRRAFHADAAGAMELTGVAPGRYRLQVTKEGFAPYSSLIDVTPDTTVSHTITLSLGTASFSVSVVGATPLAGLERPVDEIPAATQTATARELESSGALDLSDFLNRRLNNVYLNEIQGNPLQPDVNYRGYTASPLLGTPQGVSIYMDGVRLNQPFGDVVSWDLIPRIAISEMALIPGSNPLFGLNTLGGSLSIRTKDGVSHPGTTLQLSGGSFGRKLADFEHGGSTAKGLNWFLASNFFFEDGWRETSPSNVRQFFGKLGWQRERTSISLTLAYANNALIGNGLQEPRFLDRDYHSVYTKPDVTAHRAPFANLSLRRTLSTRVSLSGLAYFRYIRTRTLNGDLNEASLDQSVYQPSAAERTALAAAGFTGVPAAGATAANTPFPFWRCLGNVLLRDEPGEKCTGLLNRTSSHQRNYGVSGQLSWFTRRNQLTAGAAGDASSVGFLQSSELGYLVADRSIHGTGAFADGVTGGNVDGAPFDTRVNLGGRIRSAGFYATDTLTITSRLNLTLSGRFNHSSIRNTDILRPLAGTGSLTGTHGFDRFNPAAGFTFRALSALSLYGGFAEANRAPTSIELGCADPATPCKLPNAMTGDPPLRQVVTRTFEAGLRGGGDAESRLHWNAGWFRSANRDDILFVASPQTGFGYFKNFARTRRQGMELGLNAHLWRIAFGGGYTLLDATFQSGEQVNGTGNSRNNLALAGKRGFESFIAIAPGNHIPLVPRNMGKLYADWQATSKLTATLGLVAASGSFARGNENNLHQPDGVYYLGPGRTPGYAVANFGARYQLRPRVQLFLQVNNLFNRRYYTAAQLGPTGFTEAGAYIARPFPAVDGDFPVRQATFYAPGAPRAAWAGVRLRFR